MNMKSLYRDLCKEEKSIPIFSRDWWMDAVCGEDNWDVIVVEKGGRIVAALPYYFLKNKEGISVIQPKLTQKNGVWIKYPKNQKLTSKYQYEKKILREIIEKLEGLNIFTYNQSYDYSFTNWLPFYWKGFKQYTRYTYVIDDLKDLNLVFENIDSKTKSQIRKSSTIVQVEEDLDIEEFYKLNEMTFKRQDMDMPYSLDFVKALDSACEKNNCRKIFYAKDEQGRKHAAVYIVWDENSAYYLMGGADPELRNSDATSLLIWEAIKFSSNITEKFDFEGSMVENIEKSFSSFGAKQYQYFNISKEFKKRGLFHILAMDIYEYYPWLQNAYKKIRGR